MALVVTCTFAERLATARGRNLTVIEHEAQRIAALEARHTQAMAQAMAKERAELERVADEILAYTDSISDGADSILAGADELLQQRRRGRGAIATAQPTCAEGWVQQTYAVSDHGNDDMWFDSGALAFLTDGAMQGRSGSMPGRVARPRARGTPSGPAEPLPH